MRKNASNEPLIHDAQPHFGQKSLIYTWKTKQKKTRLSKACSNYLHLIVSEHCRNR